MLQPKLECQYEPSKSSHIDLKWIETEKNPVKQKVNNMNQRYTLGWNFVNADRNSNYSVLAASTLVEVELHFILVLIYRSRAVSGVFENVLIIK